MNERTIEAQTGHRQPRLGIMRWLRNCFVTELVKGCTDLVATLVVSGRVEGELLEDWSVKGSVDEQ